MTRIGKLNELIAESNTEEIFGEDEDVVELFKKFLENLKEKRGEKPERSEDKMKQKMKKVECKVSDIFVTMGIPANIKGYRFLREAVMLSVEQPSIINYITKKLYPTIAQRHDTTPSKVERAIRHAIEVGWNRGRLDRINEIFNVKAFEVKERPTNGEFIALVADKMLLEGA